MKNAALKALAFGGVLLTKNNKKSVYRSFFARFLIDDLLDEFVKSVAFV